MKFVIKNKVGEYLQSFTIIGGYAENIVMCLDQESAKVYNDRRKVEAVCKKLNSENNVYSTHFYNEAQTKTELVYKRNQNINQ